MRPIFFLIFFLLILSGKLKSQVNLNAGLVAFYPFNGNANDASGNGLNGTLFNGVTFTSDKQGNPNNAAHFDGIDDYIQVADNALLNSTDAMSIALYFNPEQNGTQTLIGKIDFTQSSGTQFQLGMDYNVYPGVFFGANPSSNGCIGLTNNGAYVNSISPVTTNQWYCVVATFDKGTMKMYLNGSLIKTVSAGFTTLNQCSNATLQIGMWWTLDPQRFKGTIDDIRIYNRELNQDEVNALNTCSIPSPCGIAEDFTFKQNICDPLSVEFKSSASISSIDDIKWDFGDGHSITGAVNPVNTYSAQGDYNVEMIVIKATCSDTIRKKITVSVGTDDLINTKDTMICSGNNLKLLAKPALNFCWTPSTYLDNPSLQNPTTTTLQDITYYLTAEITGANLITNGDFSAGNSGFTSEYYFTNANYTEGEYSINTNPNLWNGALSSCGDHTFGNSNMMFVNGSPIENINVWKQTVIVQPNTNYAFSTWIEALYNPNPAQLQFSINGKPLGNQITASLPTCSWTQFYTVWNSGNNTSAVISIVNKNTEIQGNDFALDDISFAPVYIKRDSIKITIEKPLVKASNDTLVCPGSQVPLSATGVVKYAWSPSYGISDPNIPNPVAVTSVTTQYVVTGTSANGCNAKDTVNINVWPKTVITKSADVAICKNGSTQLSASGGVSYTWSPQTGLNNPSISNPIATPLSNSTYTVTVTDANNCTNKDSIKVMIRPDPVLTVNRDTSICFARTVNLSANGGNQYSWQPQESLSNAFTSSPLASPTVTTTYYVLIKDTICGTSANLSTTITILPAPLVKANKSNDIDCSISNSQLSATGASQYEWVPSATLNNAGISNPVASPVTPTQYIVKGTNQYGCSSLDSVLVDIQAVNKGKFLMPSAFTPNSDGRNDCFGAKYWGYILEFDFKIFNRWGECVFQTKNPSQCWDGNYKGVPQKADVYVYIIKARSFCESSVFRKGTVALIR